jgi:hypothetical protein
MCIRHSRQGSQGGSLVEPNRGGRSRSRPLGAVSREVSPIDCRTSHFSLVWNHMEFRMLAGAFAVLTLAVVWACSGSGDSGLIGSTTGKQPPFSSPDSSWQTYQSTDSSVTFRYPPDWIGLSTTIADGVVVYPPTSDQTHASPSIVVQVIATPLDSYEPPPNTTPKATLIVDGITGWKVEDSGPAPPLSEYVALPHHSETLFIQAYIGPGVDLTPFLQALLSTMKLSSG